MPIILLILRIGTLFVLTCFDFGFNVASRRYLLSVAALLIYLLHQLHAPPAHPRLGITDEAVEPKDVMARLLTSLLWSY